MFHFDKNFGLFIGKINTNEFHKHYAIQISVSVKSEMELTIKGEEERSGNSFYIASKVVHKLISNENQLTLLINPLSQLGHQLYLNANNSQILNQFCNRLKDVLSQLEANILDFETFLSLVTNELNQFQCNCENDNHIKDDRLIKALEIIESNFEKIYSLEEIAELCFLSPSRFLHLFKERTSLNFRRYQLWNKIIKSLTYLVNHSITDTAYTFGFTDASHYTRTFKETFGVSPKFLFQKQ